MSTKVIYQSEINKALVAKRFFRIHHPAGKPSLKTIQKTLLELSHHFVKDAWRIQRNAIAFMFENSEQYENAQVIRRMRNPMTLTKNRHLQKKGRGDCKRVLESEHQKIIDYILNRKEPNLALLAVLNIVRDTGVRPCEVDKIMFNDYDNSIFIVSAKKTEDGQRGLDRTLIFSPEKYQSLLDAHQSWHHHKIDTAEYKTIPIKLMQDQLATVTKAVFPRRKSRITMKSYRHQLGSNLKASGWSRQETAAAMGHQSVNSLSCYGNIRNATRAPDFLVSGESISKVRNTLLKPCKPKIDRLQRESAESAPVDKSNSKNLKNNHI